MSDGWAIVGASGFTAAAALGGSLIGVWAQGRREHQQWLRDQRAAIYGDILRGFGRLMLEMTEMNEADPETTTTEDIKRTAKLGTERAMLLMDTLTTLQVFGSKEVDVLANEVGQMIVAEFRAAMTDGRAPSQETLTPRWHELALAIRADLGVKSPPEEFPQPPETFPDL